jgi:Fic family protein
MQIVSGPMGKEKAHFQAPGAARLQSEMAKFISWFESDAEPNCLIRAGIAHLWFVTIHPFDDGNGRVGRAILDLALARCDRRPWRCYSVAAQMREERTQYYKALELAQSGTMDVTPWLDWYLGCLTRALDAAATKVAGVLSRTRFWQTHADKDLNERQRAVLARMLMGWEGKMTNKKWQKLTNATPKTAQRDLAELVSMAIFEPDTASGRSAGYTLILAPTRLEPPSSAISSDQSSPDTHPDPSGVKQR